MMLTIYRRARSVVLTIAALVGGLCVVAVIAGALFGVRPLIVVSGSMAPGIPTGSLLFARERPVEEVEVGDIVTVNRTDGHGLITHRVETVDTVDGVITLTLKGDANKLSDPTTYTPASVGSYVFSVPGAGHLASFLQAGTGLLIGGGALLTLVALAILDPVKMTGRKNVAASAAPA